MLATVTDLGKYRAAMRPAVRKTCEFSESIESFMNSNMVMCDATTRMVIGVLFHWQRVFIRTFTGV